MSDITDVYADASNGISANSWMSHIDDNANVNSMNIPGTHDSGMYYSTAWTSEYAITQKTDIAGQQK